MKIDKRKMRGWIVVLIFFLILSAFPGFLKSLNLFYINHTASVPVGLYIAIPALGYRNGDLIAYKDDAMLKLAKENGWIPQDIEDITFIKHIATPGTVYHLSKDGGFYIGGEYIGNVSTNDGRGHALPQRPKGHYVVKTGEYLAYTRAGNSFDSRYMGEIKESQIIHRVIPLLTW